MTVPIKPANRIRVSIPEEMPEIIPKRRLCPRNAFMHFPKLLPRAEESFAIRISEEADTVCI